MANRFGLVNLDDFLAAPQTWGSCFEGGWAVLSRGGRTPLYVAKGFNYVQPGSSAGWKPTEEDGYSGNNNYIGQGANQGYALYDFRGY